MSKNVRLYVLINNVIISFLTENYITTRNTNIGYTDFTKMLHE